MSQDLMSASMEIEQIRNRYFVGSAADRDVTIQISGHTYRWKPGGRLEIKDRMDYERNKDNGNVFRNKEGRITSRPKVLEGGTAYEILRRIFSDDAGFQGGSKGLFPIFNDGRDADRAKLARQAYIRTRVVEAKTNQRYWMDKLGKVRPGDIPPVQPQHIREDLAFLAKHEAGVLDRRAFIAFDGGFDSDVRAEVEDYVKKTHPQFWKAQNFQGGPLVIVRDERIAGAQVVPERVTPFAVVAVEDIEAARPEPNEAADEPIATEDGVADEVEFLLAKADELKYEPNRLELRGLASRDPAVNRPAIEALSAKLADRAARAAEKGGTK